MGRGLQLERPRAPGFLVGEEGAACEPDARDITMSSPGATPGPAGARRARPTGAGLGGPAPAAEAWSGSIALCTAQQDPHARVEVDVQATGQSRPASGNERVDRGRERRHEHRGREQQRGHSHRINDALVTVAMSMTGGGGADVLAAKLGRSNRAQERRTGVDERPHRG